MSIIDSFYDTTLAQLIDVHDIVHIYRHTSPDPDAIGSAAGLAEIIATNYPDKLVRLAGDDTLDTQALPSPGFGAPREGDYNVNVLAIVVDTANSSRIDGDGYKWARTVVKLDHHPVNQTDPEYNFADFEHVNTGASSAAEVVTSFATRFEWEISKRAAHFLYAGLLGDTGAFSYNVRPSTFQTAATLAATGIDVVAIKQANQTCTRGQVAAYGFIASDMAGMNPDSGYHVTTVTSDDMWDFNFTADDAHAAVNAARTMEGLEAWAVAIEQAGEDGSTFFRVSLRSNGPEVAHIATHFGGGGHPRAAGCRVSEHQIVDIETMLAKAVRDFREAESNKE